MNNVPLSQQHDLRQATETEARLPLIYLIATRARFKADFKISKLNHSVPQTDFSPRTHYPAVTMQVQLAFESCGKSISQTQTETTSSIYQEEKRQAPARQAELGVQGRAAAGDSCQRLP